MFRFEKDYSFDWNGNQIEVKNWWNLLGSTGETLVVNGHVLDSQSGLFRSQACLQGTFESDGIVHQVEARGGLTGVGFTVGFHIFIDNDLVGGDVDKTLHWNHPSPLREIRAPGWVRFCRVASLLWVLALFPVASWLRSESAITVRNLAVIWLLPLSIPITATFWWQTSVIPGWASLVESDPYYFQWQLHRKQLWRKGFGEVAWAMFFAFLYFVFLAINSNFELPHYPEAAPWVVFGMLFLFMMVDMRKQRGLALELACPRCGEAFYRKSLAERECAHCRLPICAPRNTANTSTRP